MTEIGDHRRYARNCGRSQEQRHMPCGRCTKTAGKCPGRGTREVSYHAAKCCSVPMTSVICNQSELSKGMLSARVGDMRASQFRVGLARAAALGSNSGRPLGAWRSECDRKSIAAARSERARYDRMWMLRAWPRGYIRS